MSRYRTENIRIHALDLLESGPMTAWELAASLRVERRSMEKPIQSLARAGIIRCVGVQRRGVGNGSGAGRKIWSIAE